MRYWIVYPIVVLVEQVDWLFARLPRVLSAATVLVLSLVAGTLAPPYVTFWRLHDEVELVARRHAARTGQAGDTTELRGALPEAVRNRKLEPHLSGRDFEIEATAVVLRIRCRYSVDVELLPGHKHTLRFRLEVEVPVLPKPEIEVHLISRPSPDCSDVAPDQTDSSGVTPCLNDDGDASGEA